ncbi:MAG: hypothetical protein A4E45_02235 [Methanosaeta sp. PtaB.Bin039]|nr:MAG: hypothetical protein A4E45_02235 [Methanosaeta sp. PtaB.Bin039]
MRHLALVYLLSLQLLAGTALCQEVVEVFSSVESCDIAIAGDVGNCTLRADMYFQGRELQSKSISVDGPGTWILSWGVSDPREGSYQVCASLLIDQDVVSSRCHDFSYGGRVPVRFDVRDFLADSRGMHLSMLATDPTIVDIYYMLIQGEKALYISRDKGVRIGGGRIVSDLQWVWPQILEDGEAYSGRVKIVELNHGQTRAFMNSFVAKEDARITETYEDEMGASATVLGDSRVPFQGSLLFELSQNGSIMASIEKSTPILLAGDDETVEISWNQTLSPGIYRLRVQLLGRDRAVQDLRESIIEAEPIAREVQSEDASPEKSPSLPAVLAVSLVLASWAALRPKKRS